MLQNLQKIAKFQKIQLENLVDFEKCYKTRIYLQRSAPIQPKTTDILPKLGNYRQLRATQGGRRRLREAGEPRAEDRRGARAEAPGPEATLFS